MHWAFAGSIPPSTVAADGRLQFCTYFGLVARLQMNAVSLFKYKETFSDDKICERVEKLTHGGYEFSHL